MGPGHTGTSRYVISRASTSTAPSIRAHVPHAVEKNFTAASCSSWCGSGPCIVSVVSVTGMRELTPFANFTVHKAVELCVISRQKTNAEIALLRVGMLGLEGALRVLSRAGARSLSAVGAHINV